MGTSCKKTITDGIIVQQFRLSVVRAIYKECRALELLTERITRRCVFIAIQMILANSVYWPYNLMGPDWVQTFTQPAGWDRRTSIAVVSRKHNSDPIAPLCNTALSTV